MELVKSKVKSGNSKVGIYSPYGWLRWAVLPVQGSSADLSNRVLSQLGPKTSLFAFYQPHCRVISDLQQFFYPLDTLRLAISIHAGPSNGP
jgi:hypothetical protein